MAERRAFNNLPEYFRTNQNNRDYFISDDVMFEPESSEFINGYIGDTSRLTNEDLKRVPQIVENNPERQKYQLSVGAAYLNPDTERYESGSFYNDLVRQIEANGGLVNDHNRIFSTNYYAWSPPIDYDKHINFSRYYWVGFGAADVNGEYITKEPSASQTILYENTQNSIVKREVTIVSDFPLNPNINDIIENSSTADRLLYQWNGTDWILLPIIVLDDLPTNNNYQIGTFFYICRTGPDFQRPLLWSYSEQAGRWLAYPVIVSKTQPDMPREGSLWEDATVSPFRRFKQYRNGLWENITWNVTSNLSIENKIDGVFLYDIRNLSTISDGWIRNNWWRHYEDLSPYDRQYLGTTDQAIRPILEFWNGIEPVTNDIRDFRNDFPKFQVYAYRYASNDIQPVIDSFFLGAGNQGQTTIYQYRIGTGRDDLVLGFPLSFSNSGEFEFELTLETQEINLQDDILRGYRFFKDINTGFIHSIWEKSDIVTVQSIDNNGLYDIPVSVTSNPDHQILTVSSRSTILKHFTSVIRSQDGFSGSETGINSYRWSKKNPTRGAVLIDCEQTLLKTMATLQSNLLDIPETIRQISREYNKVLFKFINKLNQFWDENRINDAAGQLLVSPLQAVDSILSELFIARNETFPFYYSDMGTYLETQISGNTAIVVDANPKPILIPSSPARIGVAPVYLPEKILDNDGTFRLRGHDGVTITSFGDDRDLVWLDLQNRFFSKVPSYFTTETTNFTSRFSNSNFYLQDVYGNFIPEVSLPPVNMVVQDYQSITPSANLRVFSTNQGNFAIYDGYKWLLSPAFTDDLFFNIDDGEYYIYNGVTAVRIDRWNNPYNFEYSYNEFRRIIRREFERWVISQNINYIANDTFDENDPFTWNYKSSGIEGHYLGIYKRIYNTYRPHSHPWEVAGYNIEPAWWRTQYVPTSISIDGSPRYSRNHQMWVDFQNGIVNPINGLQRNQFILTAPIPVDVNGELLNPIDAGVVNAENLDTNRIDDDWVFGDGSPNEQAFYNSPFYPFTVTLAGYLMKNGIWVDSIWSLLYIDIGQNGDNKIWRAPHVVHQDVLIRPSVSDLPIHLSLDRDKNLQINVGLQAWISDRVQILGNDVTNFFAKIIQNTKPTLGWRTSGFINSNRTAITTLSGKRIPFEDAQTILHISPPFEQRFASGVLVTRENNGYRVFGYDLFNPFFTIELPAIPIAGGQVELREELVTEPNQHQFTLTDITLPSNMDTATFAVLINGLKIKNQHITITGSNTFEIESIININGGEVVAFHILTVQSNPSTRTKTFKVGTVDFPYFASGSGQLEDIEYGRFFESSSDVINFMLGYGRYLEKQGWIFDRTDENSELQDWLTGAKKFATWVLNVESPWNPNGIALEEIEDFKYSPIARQVKLETAYGQISNLGVIQFGTYGILDNQASPINADDLIITRVSNELVVDTKDITPDIFGVRTYHTEYEHAVLFSNTTRFGDIIYNPVLALFHNTLRTESYRTKNWKGRPETNGFILGNNNTLLPNFEKQAKDVTRFYDNVNAVDDPLRRDQARNLYGWYPNDSYMNAVGADDRTRFDYYKGLLNAKGTNRSIKAFSKGTRLGQDNVIVNEDWAWKLCEYGDKRREIAQFVVYADDFREELQVIEFSGPDVLRDNIIQVLDFDRNNPNNSTRWIIPPVMGQERVTNLRFPVTPIGLPDVDNVKFYSQLFNTNDGLTILRHFHYDPQLDKFDPEILSIIDYLGYYDPARYTNGPGEVFSNELAWGFEQVGNVWWSYKKKQFVNYRSQLPNYDIVSREWGKLLYYKATILRNSDVVTVTTLDPYSSQSVNHNLKVGDIVSISGAQEADYNGFVTITSVTNTTFQYRINHSPNSPATGNIIVTVGEIEIYEWVESPVPPSDWNNYISNLRYPGAPTGIVENPLNASYVQRNIIEDGRNNILYYFWIKNNTGINGTKDITSFDIKRRLENPTSSNISWFAPIDENHMVIFTDGQKVQDNYAIELITDHRKLETHIEWTLISEGDRFRRVPDKILSKVIDSLSQIDEQNGIVPSPLLSETERYGNEFFPPQTIFRNRETALNVYVKAINEILKTKNIASEQNLTTLFPLSSENTFWKRTSYIEEPYVTKPVFDIVATNIVRNDRAQRGFYTSGDIIKVLQSSNNDPWNNQIVGTYYLYDDNGSFTEIGIDNFTIEINDTIANNQQQFRNLFYRIFEFFEREEVNSVIFSILHEMLRQNPICDWFFKTSYISVQIFDVLNTSPFVRPSEPEAILNNIRDVKPYRTKLRSQTLTYSVSELENMSVNLLEIPQIKTTLLIDRLSCNLAEDGGWDGYPWDTELKGWDKPFWYFENLGQEEWQIVDIQYGDSLKTYFDFYPDYDPTLYDHRVITRLNGQEIDLSLQNVTCHIEKNHTRVRIIFNTQLSFQFSVELQQSIGFVEGQEPTLPQELLDVSFRPVPSTYEHHLARTLIPGQYNPTLDMQGCQIGNNPEERINNNVIDSVNICVTNYYTNAYSGWDTTPWDTTPWDSAPDDIGERVLIQSVGNQEIIPPGIQMLPTSETFTLTDYPYVVGNNNDYDIVDVKVNGISKTLGMEYEFVEGFKHIIKFNIIPDLFYTADGMTMTFDISSLPNGISNVYLDGMLQTLNIDYVINDNDLQFVQPLPTITPIYSIPQATSTLTDGIRTRFPTNNIANSLNKDNIFLFNNSNLVLDVNYSIDNNDVMFNNAPANNRRIIVSSFGTDIGDNDPLFARMSFNGNGSTTLFNIGSNGNKERTFVFKNRRYQIFGVDYTHPINGQIQFISAPLISDTIEVRVLSPMYYVNYEFSHIVLNASGTNTDMFIDHIGVNANSILIFVNDVLQDGFTTLGSPDYTLSIAGGNTNINWLTIPNVGDKISIRVIKTVTISQNIAINVKPAFGSSILIVPLQNISNGDIVTYVYNGWPVGKLGGYRVTNSPDDWDIVKGKLTLNTPIPSENQYITVNYSINRYSDTPRSLLVRSENIVDDILDDHLVYDNNGFETNRRIGKRVINSTDNNYYMWNGYTWNNDGNVINGSMIFIKRLQIIVQFNGTDYNTVFTVGDTYVTPPILNYPKFGLGVTYGTYALGQLSSASIDFPEAYEIIQHEGLCD